MALAWTSIDVIFPWWISKMVKPRIVPVQPGTAEAWQHGLGNDPSLAIFDHPKSTYPATLKVFSSTSHVSSRLQS